MSHKRPQKKRILAYGIGILLAIVGVITAVCIMRTPLPISDPQGKLNTLIGQLDLNHLSYTATTQTTTTILEETFTETKTSHITIAHTTDGALEYQATESIQIGSHQFELQEAFENGKCYTIINGTGFVCNTAEDEFSARILPFIPATVSNYTHAEGTSKNGTYTITLSAPTDIEDWFYTDGIILKDATAAFEIGRNNTIKQITYTCAYTSGDRSVTLSVIIEPSIRETHIAFPDNKDTYILVDSPDVARAFEIACGYLLSANTVSATYTDSIICEAFGDQRTQTITMHTAQDTDWSAYTKTHILLSNTSKNDADTSFTKTEHFDGTTLTTTIDHNAPTKEITEAPDSIKSSCQDTLVGTIVLPWHIRTVEVIDNGSSICVNFTATEDFALLLSNEACTTLYRDGQLLSNLASNYSTQNVTCYLEISKATGLPTASGFYYEGIYEIEGHPYCLTFSADQKYTILGDNAIKEIKKGTGQ